MRRRVIIGVVLAAAAVAAAAALAKTIAGSEPAAPAVAAPRVCWQNDYSEELPRLANKCEYRANERRWYLEVDGETGPADEVSLSVANLCIYFWGPRCPTEEEKRKGLEYRPGS